jgi:hypothetical protein
VITRGTRRPAESDRTRKRPRTRRLPRKARLRVTGEQHRAVAEAASADSRLAGTLTVTELRALIRDAALDAVADLVPPTPALLDRTGLDRAPGVGTSSVDRFRREGMPLGLGWRLASLRAGGLSRLAPPEAASIPIVALDLERRVAQGMSDEAARSRRRTETTSRP